MEHAQRAAVLTRQLLVFSRRSVLETKVLDFNDIITHLLRMVGRLIGEHIQLHFDPNPGLPGVEVDPGMMEQVLLNLCVNARDAMPHGGDLTISLEAVSIAQAPMPVPSGFQPGPHVCLSVRDTGCGMDEATLHRIFEPFFTTKPVGQGTGLGLATVHGIVGQHHGWIEVESHVGQGSTFRVYFPASPKPAASAPVAVAAPVAGGRETILLVEDDEALRSITVKNLRRLGYQVAEAANGQEALDLARANPAPVDLLITDLVMPRNLSGVDVVRRIRELRPGQKAIIVSGYTSDIAELQKLPASEIHFLRKPYSTEELVKTIRQCLAGS
jgi:CheY-like chemotaxis protein